MARPVYDDAFKAEAIALAVEHGPAEAARSVGVRAGTVRAWCSRAGVATVTAAESTRAATEVRLATMEQRRTQLADRLLAIAEMSAEQAVGLVGDASLRDLVGAWDYAIKNSQLLSGGATARDTHEAEPAHAVVDEVAARRNRAA